MLYINPKKFEEESVWGSSQAKTEELKKECELGRTKELKDRVQTIEIRVLTHGKRSVFDSVY